MYGIDDELFSGLTLFEFKRYEIVIIIKPMITKKTVSKLEGKPKKGRVIVSAPRIINHCLFDMLLL